MLINLDQKAAINRCKYYLRKVASGFIILKTYKYSKTKEVVRTQGEFDNIIVDNKDIPKDQKDRLQNNLRAERSIVVFCLSTRHVKIGEFF